MADVWRHHESQWLTVKWALWSSGVMIASESLVPTFLERGIFFGRDEFCEQDGLWCYLTLEGFLCEPWAMLVGHLVLPEGWYGVRARFAALAELCRIS